jgi:hypothetical protein
MRGDRFTTGPELIAYLGAHALGLFAQWLANSYWFPWLVLHGYRGQVRTIGIFNSWAIILAVLAVFLPARRRLTRDRLARLLSQQAGLRESLTDGPELVAYLAAHALGWALSYFVLSGMLSALVRSGYRAEVQVLVWVVPLAITLVVLLIFLVLRRRLLRRRRQT